MLGTHETVRGGVQEQRRHRQDLRRRRIGGELAVDRDDGLLRRQAADAPVRERLHLERDVGRRARHVDAVRVVARAEPGLDRCPLGRLELRRRHPFRHLGQDVDRRIEKRRVAHPLRVPGRELE